MVIGDQVIGNRCPAESCATSIEIKKEVFIFLIQAVEDIDTDLVVGIRWLAIR